MVSKTKTTTISIPTMLAEKIREKCEGTGFNSISIYVTYVLRQVIAAYPKKGEPGSKEETEQVKENLKGLGYLK